MAIGAHRNWPPTWVWIGGQANRDPKGEIGVLKAVRRSFRAPVRSDRLFLIMEHGEALYMGCLLFGDHSFCEWLFTTLHSHLGKPIDQIGALDISITM